MAGRVGIWESRACEAEFVDRWLVNDAGRSERLPPGCGLRVPDSGAAPGGPKVEAGARSVEVQAARAEQKGRSFELWAPFAALSLEPCALMLGARTSGLRVPSPELGAWSPGFKLRAPGSENRAFCCEFRAFCSEHGGFRCGLFVRKFLFYAMLCSLRGRRLGSRV